MKYPAGIPDYFKQAFPEGLTYDRKLTFEDGGCATATVEMRWVIPYYLTVNQTFNLQITQRSLSYIFEWSKTKIIYIFLHNLQHYTTENSRRISMMNIIMKATNVQ